MLPVELSELMKGLGKGNTDPTGFEQMGIAHKCGKCGNGLVAEAHFCSKCGEKITR